jgi:hypothetical protein
MESGRVLMNFSTEELGSDDPVVLDMSQYMTCKAKLYMEASKGGMVKQTCQIMSDCHSTIGRQHYKTMFKQLRKDCA